MKHEILREVASALLRLCKPLITAVIQVNDYLLQVDDIINYGFFYSHLFPDSFTAKLKA